MKGTDTAKNKIQKICDIIKLETIEPAQQEAREIVENAHLRAKEIVTEAEKTAKEINAKAQREIDQKKKVYESSLQLACRQALDSLRQKIEKELFQPALSEMIHKGFSQPDVVAKMVNAIVEAVEKEGIDSDLSAVVGKAVSPKEVNQLIVKKIAERLKDKGVILGDFKGGMKLTLHNNRITIDVSEDALKELIGTFVRKEFRELFFGESV